MTDLPSVTIVIEWENAIDTEDKWAQRAVAGLARELAATGPRMPARPAVTYLYDSNQVDPAAIRDTLAAAAEPRLDSVADVEIVPTAGLSYYQLKNFGVARAKTNLSVILDSDASPQPGWLEGMLVPFDDPAIMAVGGITVLGYEDLLSRTMALTWIFGLMEERQKTARKHGIYANNTAVRSAFLRSHPFPDLTAFKKQCVFWLRGITAQGYGYVRVADAVTIHAPHPGYGFVLWRAWKTGQDRDFQAYHVMTRGRLGRLGYAGKQFFSRLGKSWWRLITKRRSVGLPVWQLPAAMLLSLGYVGTASVAQLASVIGRRHRELPAPSPAGLAAAN